MDPSSSSSSSPPPSPPSPSSPLLPMRPTSWEHDVFLCFRGEDTREGFTGHLYHELKDNCGINTFMDEQLPKGKEISKLQEKIESSRIAVVIFSPNFASSRWCLDELVKIMECHRDRNTAGHEVLPVFYKVAPTELRGPKGKTAEHLAAIPERDPEKVETWRLALEELSNLKGWSFTQGSESRLIKEIVEVVRSILNQFSLEVIRSRVNQVSLEVGAGKTKELSDYIRTKVMADKKVKVAIVATIVCKVFFLALPLVLSLFFLVFWIKASIKIGFWSEM